MKAKTTQLLLCLCSIFTLVLGTPSVKADQPMMDRAIEQLELARKRDHIEHLEKAKHDLEEAAHNKGGERREAIHHIDEAINAAHAKEHERMEKHIDMAISDVRAGKHEARGK